MPRGDKSAACSVTNLNARPADGADPPCADGATGASAASNDPAPAYRWRWLVLAVTVGAAVMDQLDTTVINVAAPTVRADLGGSPAVLQWLSAGYTLPFAALLIIGGRLGDLYGRRRMFLVGLVGFTAASLACAAAAAPALLIAARVVQGGFGAVLIPQGFGIVRSVFSREEMPLAFGAFAPALGLSSVFGPTLAGALIGADVLGTGWRMIFLINVPIGLAALGGALAFVPRHQHRTRMQLDLLGVTLVTVAAVLVIYPLVQGPELGWPWWCFAMIASGLTMFAAFIAYERATRRAAVIEASLLANRTFTAGLTVAVAFFAAVGGFLFAFGLYLQLGLRFSPLHAGLTALPTSVGILLSATASRWLTPRLGRRLLHAGLLIVTLGLVVLAATTAHFGLALTTWNVTPGALLVGLGMGLVFGPLFGVILGAVSDSEVGSASGTLSAVQQLGGVLGVAGITTMYFALAGHAHATTTAATTTALAAASAVVVAFGLVFLLPKQTRANR